MVRAKAAIIIFLKGDSAPWDCFMSVPFMHSVSGLFEESA